MKKEEEEKCQIHGNYLGKVSMPQCNSVLLKELRTTTKGKNNKKRPALVDVTNAELENLPTKEKCKKITQLKEEKSKKDADTDMHLNDSNLMEKTPEHSPGSIMEILTPPEQSFHPVIDVHKVLKDVATEYDESNRGDVDEAPEFAAAIFRNVRHREQSLVIKEDYMKTVQTEVTWEMRGKLIDWIVEIQGSLGLQHETLYLAVNIIDRYLLKEEVSKENMQLVGAAAMYITAKLNEVNKITCEQLMHLSDYTFDAPQLFAKERKFLITIDFQLVIPSSYDFLRRFAKCAFLGMPRLTLARYVLELSLLDEGFLKVLPSKMAAACLWLSFKMGKPYLPWNHRLVIYSDYEEIDLMEVVVKLNDMLTRVPENPLETIREKYESPEFFRVAFFKPLPSDRLEQEKNRITLAKEVIAA